MPKGGYDHAAIDTKWQRRWAADKTYRTTEGSKKGKAYVLDMFPYPSGEGLHVGHPKGYVATDIYSRLKRMQGFSVLHPMGWDAFGLPAENYAIKNKVHPRVAVEKNIERFKDQLERIGFDYDWEREINTTDPAYYKWTQWIFLKLLEKGLAYESHAPINWCPSCQTGLANEDLEHDGTCERCGSVVEKKPMRQWVLKITDYADRLLADLDTLSHWPEHIKEQQRNWIGRSEGAKLWFPIVGRKERIEVFTTRPDTVFGATYVVLAPEHPLIASLTARNADEITAYIETAGRKTERERGENKEKSGVVLEGVMAVNPATKEEVPVYVADYVLASYGTGAVMAVPAHDERDYAFAKKYDLPIRAVVAQTFIDAGNPPVEGKEFVAREGTLSVLHDPKTNRYLTLDWPESGWTTFVTGGIEKGEEAHESGAREIREETGYRNIRFVRELIPAVETRFFASHKNVNRIARSSCLLYELIDDVRDSVAAEEATLHTPTWRTTDEIRAIGMRHAEIDLIIERLSVEAGAYTGDGSLVHSGSFDGRNNREAFDAIIAYAGGEKTTKYRIQDWVFSRQRYWGEPIPVVHCEKDGVVPVPYTELPVVLPDVESYAPTGTGESPLAAIDEWVNTTCPKCGGKATRETNTMPQWAGSSWYYLRFMDPKNDAAFVSEKAERYWEPVDVYVGGDHAVRHLIYARFWHKFLHDLGVVSTDEPFAHLEFLGFILAEDGRKMSKRFGNVINPNDVVAEHGADAFRVYEMFMGPFENTIAWSTEGIVGARRFLDRVARLAKHVLDEDVSALEKVLHKTVLKVSGDIEAFKFNTAVSQMMIFVNEAEVAGLGRRQFETFLKVLAPFAPHLTEELWESIGHTSSIHLEMWPEADTSLLVEDIATVAVQVAGKRKGEITLAPDASEEEAVAAALRLPAVASTFAEKEPGRVVYVPGKILNLVP